MSHKRKKLYVVIGILILTLLCLIHIPYGTTNYTMPNSNIVLKVPKFSSFKEECCMFSASFQSFRSKFSLQLELEKIMTGYEKMECHNKTVYYDKKADITIHDYGVESGFFFRKFYITYDKGKPTNNECSVVTDATKTKYQIDYRLKNERDICYHSEKFQYWNKDGNIYDVYYQCFGDILFQSGMNKMHYLNDMLSRGWISMDDVINFLEYQVIQGKAKKQEFKDGGSIMYMTKDFHLLKCNRLMGNQDIYIGSTNMKYDQSTQCINLGIEVE